jgi:hypothetical protein
MSRPTVLYRIIYSNYSLFLEISNSEVCYLPIGIISSIISVRLYIYNFFKSFYSLFLLQM